MAVGDRAARLVFGLLCGSTFVALTLVAVAKHENMTPAQRAPPEWWSGAQVGASRTDSAEFERRLGAVGKGQA